MNYWDDVTKDDFEDETMSLMVETLVRDAIKKVVKMFGGDSVYVPKAESVIRKSRDRRIFMEFKKGYRYRELAVRHNLTTRYVREIISAQKKSNRIVTEEQLEIF
ncbi:MAG: hypothetical protein L3J69_06030 [Desulfobacula sp.]|nr:hypothetical protein [Desulfobacula sp.]